MVSVRVDANVLKIVSQLLQQYYYNNNKKEAILSIIFLFIGCKYKIFIRFTVPYLHGPTS